MKRVIVCLIVLTLLLSFSQVFGASLYTGGTVARESWRTIRQYSCRSMCGDGCITEKQKVLK